ncbi:MAG: diaminopimelate epimerase [Candidatus Sericytochromatia bacterium]
MKNFIDKISNEKNISFVKMQGCGNDFIIIDYDKKLENKNLSELAIKLCNRNFGIGADGLIINHSSKIADFRMQIINSDGSEPEMCGNGIRCFARYLEILEKTDKKDLKIETLAGIIKPKLVKKDNFTLVEVDMGNPILEADKIPVAKFSSEKVINENLVVDNQNFNFTAVSMGNPHCIIYVDDFKNLDFEKWGPKIEAFTEVFPKKVNVEFVTVDNEDNLSVKVWERGAGPTLACGTGACAVLVSSVLNNKSKRKANVHLPGGTLNIEWKDDNTIIMTGPAEVSFYGAFEL